MTASPSGSQPSRAAEYADCRSPDGRAGEAHRSANPNDELERTIELQGGAYVRPPGVLFKRVRHRVMCHPKIGGPQESTLIHGPGVKQRPDAAIDAGDQEEASATL